MLKRCKKSLNIIRNLNRRNRRNVNNNEAWQSKECLSDNNFSTSTDNSSIHYVNCEELDNVPFGLDCLFTIGSSTSGCSDPDVIFTAKGVDDVVDSNKNRCWKTTYQSSVLSSDASCGVLAVFSNPEVREFLSLDSNRNTTSSEEDDLSKDEFQNVNIAKNLQPVDLGITEESSVQPSDFEFLKVIGKGSFGKVLLARHKSEHKIYAVKVLQKAAIVKRNEVRHIMSERNVLVKNVQHPFLVGLHYSFQTSKKLYFVLDYVNGGERERFFTENRAMFYAAEIASALGYLHSEDIIYRDLKPENLLLDSKGHVVLTDFGLCKEGITENDTTCTFCGTPEYLAPEVLKKLPYDKTVDWWCLGAVLYEMVYGLPPFYSRNTAEMYDNILHKPVRLHSSISTAGRNIIEELLRKDKSKRLGAKHDFKEIQQKAFFANINWNDLYTRKVQPPYNPQVNDQLDLKHFDPEFVQEPVPASVSYSNNSTCRLVSASVMEADSVFSGFSYVPPSEDAFE